MPSHVASRTVAASSGKRVIRTATQATAISLAVGVLAPQGWADNDRHAAPRIPFEASKMIIEFNSTDEDIGIQFFVDVDSWKLLQIFDPRGKQIFEATATSKLRRQGGGTELFLESSEPTLDELPIEKFFARFPEGTYRFTGLTPDGKRLIGTSEFTHDLPAGPEIVTPTLPNDEGCAENVPLPVVIAWNPVTTSIDGDPINVVDYEVIVGEPAFDVHLSGTMVTVPAELLEPGTEYGFEVLAIEEGGNQTITESCLVTAD
jgi:hypothetical protein